MAQVPPEATFRPLVQVVEWVFTMKPVLVVTAGLPRVSVLPVLLTRVIVVAALATPTAWLPKDTVLGLRITLLVPVPLTPAICGELGSLSLMITAPSLAPVDFGAKATPIAQLAPPANVLPEAGQLFDFRTKSLVSFSVMAPIVMDEVPLFFTVMVFVALLLPTSCAPKLIGAPVTVIAEPVPDRLTVELPLKKPLSLMVRVPTRIPEPVGEK